MTQTAADPRDEIIETQKRVITTQREENQRLRRKLQWYEEMHGHEELPQNARLAGIALRKVIDTSLPGPDGFFRADLRTMGKSTGVSSSTSSRGIHCLAENTDAIELRVEKHPYDPQQEILKFRPRESFDRPPDIAITGDIKRHGGAREADRCHCGGTLVEKTRTLRRQRHLQCDSCHKTARIYPAENTEIREWPVTPFQDETVDDDPPSTPFQDETVASEDAPSGEFFDAPLQDANRITLQIPPPDCNASLPVDTERDAAQLLLEIAGTAPEHIEMCKTGDSKYVTVKRSPHQGDMLAHLRGYQMKGATLRHPFGLTRASCDDADSAEDWQRLKQAARQLALAGYQVILEPSPAIGNHQGGGHLWVIYDRLVDAYSARQTMLQYAPMLSESKECWPREGNHRVRLPGGKYVRPGVAAWCKLEDVLGNELSHDGAGTALVLIQYQTPAAIVNTYDKPAPVLEMRSEKREQAAHAGVPGKNDDRAIMATINDSFSWDELAALCGGYNRRGYFPAIWRNNEPPYDVKVDPKTDKAKDFGNKAWLGGKPMDKHQVWCLIQGGENWEAFKKSDLAERCKQLRKKDRAA